MVFGTCRLVLRRQETFGAGPKRLRKFNISSGCFHVEALNCTITRKNIILECGEVENVIENALARPSSASVMTKEKFGNGDKNLSRACLMREQTIPKPKASSFNLGTSGLATITIPLYDTDNSWPFHFHQNIVRDRKVLKGSLGGKEMMAPTSQVLSLPLLVFSFACLAAFIPSVQWKLKTSAVSVRKKTEGTSSSTVQTDATNITRQAAFDGPSQSDDGRKNVKSSANSSGSFPITEFTPHVQQLLDLVNLEGGCGSTITLTVSTPNSVPAITCTRKEKGQIDLVLNSWCEVLKRIYLEKQRVLPFNVSLSFSRADRMQAHKHEYRCFESSAVNGEMCLMNFLEMDRMAKGIEYPIIPWENRSRIPIWRGTPWVRKGTDVKDLSKVVENALSRSPRLSSVAWSLEHPELLDAKIGNLGRLENKELYWQQRNINGMDKLYPGPSFIPQEDYYTRYQVALVLGGFGAAFRTSIHLSTETAVVLQEFEFKEWFTPMMKPFEHYIPLSEDLSDLDERMHWVAEHPEDVHQIARNGRKFYERYLSFEKNEEHIAELAYRMALLTKEWEAASSANITRPVR